MHPALNILGVILFIPLVAHGGLLAGMAGAVGVAVLLSRVRAWRRCLELNRRLRWFYLSIVLLYGWFTAGEALLPAIPAVSPTLEGLWLGLGRALILVIVVGAVVWLLARSSREELVGAILWLTGPLARLGFPRERFAVRLVLTLETVPRLQSVLAGVREEALQAHQPSWTARARALVDHAVQEAYAAPLAPMEIPRTVPPRWHHWLGLAAVLVPLLAFALWRPL